MSGEEGVRDASWPSQNCMLQKDCTRRLGAALCTRIVMDYDAIGSAMSQSQLPETVHSPCAQHIDLR